MTSASLAESPHNRHFPKPDYQARCQTFLDYLTDEQQTQVQTWLKLGNQNRWIVEAWDPPFDALSFCICKDINDLAERILEGNWCLGQAYVLDNICFINQVNGGDEWLTIKGNTPFESITMQTFDESREEAEARLFQTIGRIQAATEEQCKKLEY